MSYFKPFLFGLIVGVIATPVVGFSFFDWTFASKAENMAQKAAQAADKSALVPVCVERFKASPDAASNLAMLKTLKEEGRTSYKRMRIILEGGWANRPGTAEPVPGLADDCAAAILGDKI